MPNPDYFEPDGILQSADDRVDAEGISNEPRVRRRRRRPVIVVAAVTLALATTGVAIVLARRLEPAANAPALVGEHAPAFVLDGLVKATESVSLESFEGRPVVINFWASWCVPCRTEMPALEAVHTALGERLGFVGINHLDDRPSALRLIEETGVTYESGFDPQGAVAADYGLFGLPTTVLVSADGIVVAEVTGAVTEASLLSMIEDLLGVTPG